MNLHLRGGDCRYALEQMALTLFPDEPHPWKGEERPAAGENAAECRLFVTDRHVTASVRIRRGEKSAPGLSRAALPLEADAQRRGELEKQALRRAFYKAALPFLDAAPPWGALSGVRPAKLARRFLAEAGGEPSKAVRLLERTNFLHRDKAELAVACALLAVALQREREPLDVDVYVGIPFCPSRCSYCSFVSAAVDRMGGLLQPYLDGLGEELAAGAAVMRRLGLRARTVYVGGGTPTVLDAPQLAALCRAIAGLPLSGDLEYTVEAGRPDTVTAEKLAVLREAGVNRISVNPQTMDDALLAAVGRRHTAAQVEEIMALAVPYGFDAVNMDLIAGLPGDTPENFLQSLRRVLALAPENITVHTLARKRGADLRHAPQILPPEALAAMLEGAEALLRPVYEPYYVYRQKYMGGSFENIGWTVPGRVCRYNIAMMEETGSVLGFGAGAVTKLVRGALVRRLPNPKYPQEYLRDILQITAEKEAVIPFYEA